MEDRKTWFSGIRERRRTRAGEAALVAVALVLFYFLVRMSPVVARGAFGDDGIYVALGKALATGEGYRSIYAAGEPVHVKYPPGVPAIFALLWLVGGDLPGFERLVSILNPLACGGAAGLVWWIGRSRLRLSAPVVFVFAVLPFGLEASIQYLNLPISEPYFILVWLAGLALYYQTSEARGTRADLRSVALGVVFAASVLVRVQGIVLLPAVLLAMLIDRAPARRIGLFSLSASLPILGWWLWRHWLIIAGPISSQPDEASYLSWVPWQQPLELIGFAKAALMTNWTSYWRIIPAQLSGWRPLGLTLAISVLLLAALAGTLLLRRHPALVLTTLATAVVIALWPYSQERFVLTILPCAGLLAAAGADHLLVQLKRNARVLAYALIGLVVIAVSLRQLEIRDYASPTARTARTDQVTYPSRFLIANTAYLLATARWVLENTDRTDRILFESPAGLYLYTGRTGVSSAPAESQIATSVFKQPGGFLAARIQADGIDILVLGGLDSPVAREIAVLQRRCPDLLSYAGKAEAGWPVFYRVTKPRGCAGDLASWRVGMPRRPGATPSRVGAAGQTRVSIGG